MLRVEINLKIDNDNYKEEVVKLLKIKSSDIKTISINKKSVDARRRDGIHYHYSIDIELESKLEDKLLKNKKLKLNKVVKEEYQIPKTGSNKLKEIIPSIRNKIIKMGGEFRFSTKLTDIKIENEKVVAVTLNDKEQLPCNVLILAIGHSARDTFHLLDDKNLLMESKPFAVGVRVMHYQKMIDKEQYQNKIKKAPYKLTYQTKNHRGVYSFCMCPGGYVINSASENNSLVVNGMSNYLRDSNTANSAIVVTVSKKDYGEGLFAGVKYQQELEKKAYLKGNGKIPVEYYQDFLNKKITKKETDFAILGAYTFTDLNDILPVTISDSIKEAMIEFNKKIKNFSDSNPLLAGVETRTSSPINIIRDEKLESNIKGIYPCGEGSGYAGGITSSAIDGIKVAEEIIKKYYY